MASLHINTQTGYFGRKWSGCFLVSLVNLILSSGERKASRFLGVHRKDLYSSLFKIEETWDKIVTDPQQVTVNKLPELVEKLLQGKGYGFAYLGGCDEDSKFPENRDKYFYIADGSVTIPHPSILLTPTEKVLGVEVEGNAPNAGLKQLYKDLLDVGHSYTFLGYTTRMGIKLNELVDSDGSVILRKSRSDCFGGIVLKTKDGKDFLKYKQPPEVKRG